jgi:hypothetical protein
MSARSTSSVRRAVAVVAMTAILSTGMPAAWSGSPWAVALLPHAAPVAAQASQVGPLVEAFRRSLTGSAAQQRAAAIEVLKHYEDYKTAVGNKLVDKVVARGLDEQLVGMCQEAWRDVAVKYGSGLDHVVPVGTLGHRFTNTAYIPGKSDKDFIPRGAKASEAAQDFASTFQERFGLTATDVDVNALDPSNPAQWPDRYRAATNPEKYNTVGGNKWLATEEALQKPNLWAFDPTSGRIREVWYESVVKTPPPPLTQGDALGWFSDNTKFRTSLAEHGYDPRMLALKQAKYDLRNADAFRLAGGQLSDADRALLSAADMLRNGKVDAAIGRMMSVTGEMDPDRALATYLRSMDDLTATMGRAVADSHLRLMALVRPDSRLSTTLTNDLAGALLNLPRAQRIEAIEAMTRQLGRGQTDEIVKLANVFERRVFFGMTYFDDAAMASFGRRYDALTDAERSVLHGADEAAESFLGKAARTTGYVFSGYAIWTAYEQGAKHGTAVGVGSAMARAVIEALQAGVPIVAVGEVIGQLTAGAIELGANAYKNAVLEELYQHYARDPSNLDFLLDIQSVVGWYAGGIRQLAIDLKMKDKGLTDEQIRQRLADHLRRRLEAERAAAQEMRRVADLVAWLDDRRIELLSTSDLGKLTADDMAALAALMEASLRVADELRALGIPVNDENIKALLFHRYSGAGTPETYEAALRSLWEAFHAGETWPPAGRASACTDRPVVKAARDATVSRASGVPAGGVLMSGAASFREKPPDAWCDPAVQLPAVIVPSGGTIRITLDGSPPVPCTWSMFNNGIGVSLSYAPLIGRNEGPAQGVASLGLTCTVEGDADTHAETTAVLPGPGRLRGTIMPASGAGPLTGSCFAQSGSATVTMVEPSAEGAVPPETTLAPGDRIATGDNGTAVLMVPGFVSVRIRGSSAVRSGLGAASPPLDSGDAATCAGGPPGLTLEQGGLRSRTLPGGASLPLRVRGRTVTPEGTDLVVEALPDGSARVAVLEGQATVTAEDGSAVTVAAGQQLVWPGDLIDPIAPGADELWTDALLGAQPLDDTVPAPYGDWSADLETGTTTSPGGPDLPVALPDGWTWLDPDRDAALESRAPGHVTITTPPGNELWSRTATAPLLLRRVTGDFDLEADLRMETGADDLARAQFVVDAPGSMIGMLAGQMDPASPAVDVQVLGGGWTRTHGTDELAGFGCDVTYTPERCPDARGPVRVRLSRRGDIWRTYRLDASGDWVLTTRREIRVPETVWAGWSFERIAYDGLADEHPSTTISNVRLVSAPFGSLEPPAWDIVSDPGDVGSVRVAEPARSPEGVRSETADLPSPAMETIPVDLILTGVAFGSVAAQGGRVLDGDFEVVVRVDAEPWTRQGGEARSLVLEAVAVDGSEQASVAFHEADARRVIRAAVSSVEVSPPWYEDVTTRRPPSTWLRLVRRDGHVTAGYWEDCRWRDFTSSGIRLTDPLFVRVAASDELEATTPAPLVAGFTVERIADGPSMDELAAWEPVACSVTAPAEIPVDLVLPEGLTATAARAPYPLGRVFFDPDGAAYAFGRTPDEPGLLRITPDGMARSFSEDDLLWGVNRKSGLWLDGRLLVGVEYEWYSATGGNPWGGIYELAADGTFRPWQTVRSIGGLSDLIAAPEGGVLISDDEADNIFHLATETAPERPVITQGAVPGGIVRLAFDAATRALYALSVLGEGDLGGPAGIYRITPDGAAELIAAPPEESANLGAIAVSPGGVLEAGLYATDPIGGRVLAVRPDGGLEPVIEGIPGVTEAAFDPLTGDLLVTWDEDRLLRIGTPAPGEG